MTGIDFHQHLWGDAFRRALERRTEPPYLRADRLMLPHGGTFEVDPLEYSPAARLAELDEQGLAHAVVSLAPTTEPTRDLVEVWHEEALQLEGSSGGRLVPLAYCEARSGFGGAIVPATDLLDLEGAASLFSLLMTCDQGAFRQHSGRCMRSPSLSGTIESG